MEVTLIPVNETEVINKLFTACRTCYNAGTPNDMYRKVLSEPESFENTKKKLKLLDHVIRSGHHSVLEHVQLTFLISGISRAASMQLIRHRLCNISQQSQRYCEFKDGAFEYVIPAKIEKDDDLRATFDQLMGIIGDAYKMFIDAGVPAEDARAVLPNACTTNLTWSCNLREFIHVVEERTCTMAQAEIRKLVRSMVGEVVTQLPFMKPYLGPKCEHLGYCNEAPSRSCGMKPTRNEVIL